MADDHYFSESPNSEDRRRTISVRLAGRDLQLTTSSGTFSPGRLDLGTKVLLDAVPDPPAGDGDPLLDLGCGWGPIAISAALRAPGSAVWAVDVNSRSLDLTRLNARALGLENVTAAVPDDVPADLSFRTIWSNPPIRVGKEALHELLLRWLPRLAPGGEAWLVVAKGLGGDSLHAWLQEALGEEFATTREASSKGYRVLLTTRAPSR